MWTEIPIASTCRWLFPGLFWLANIELSCAADPDCEANPGGLHAHGQPGLSGVSFNDLLSTTRGVWPYFELCCASTGEVALGRS